MKNKLLTIVFLMISVIGFGQNFKLNDPDNFFSKKEKAVFETAVNYELAFYNRIFTDKSISFSELKFTVAPNYMQYLLYQSQNGGSVHQNSGFYAPARKELVVCKDKKFESTFLKTCFHELSHAFLHLHTDRKSVPAWLNEGLAVYLEQMIFSSKKITQRVNKYHLVRVKTLIELQEINLSEFVNWNYQKFAAESFTQEGYGYAVSYCIVLFLMQKDENRAIEIIRHLVGAASSTEIFDKYYSGGFAQFEVDFIEKYKN